MPFPSLRDTIVAGMLLLPCIYCWRKFYKTYTMLKRDYENSLLFYQRHNCVVMHSKLCTKGWPPNYVIKIDTNNLRECFEPYLYFINTANQSLDVALMILSIPEMLEALQNAVTKGVKVRLIINFATLHNNLAKYKKLLHSGVKIAFYVNTCDKTVYIMHYKYLVKDYSETGGFLCIGSLNLSSINSVMMNYEDMTFSTDPSAVRAFHTNFNESWDLIMQDNENAYNKSVLRDAGLL